MSRPGPITSVCVCAALAVAAAGCGESAGTTSTKTTASAPAGEAPPTVSQSTGSTGTTQAKPTKPSHHEPAAAVKPPVIHKIIEKKALKPVHSTPKPVTPKAGTRFPTGVKVNFLDACLGAKGSTASCECVIARQELLKVEKGQAIAELVIVEAAMLQKHLSFAEAAAHTVLLPELVHQSLKACNGVT